MGEVGSQHLTRVARRAIYPKRPVAGFQLTRETARQAGRRAAVVAVLVVVILLPCVAWLEGAEAKKGFAVRNVYPRGFIVLPILAVQAVPARVEWVAEKGPAAIEGRECLLYLGAHDGTAVFYDVRTRDSVRLPTSAISTVLTYKSGTPTDCYQQLANSHE